MAPYIKIDIKATDMIRLISNRHIDIDSISKDN